MLTALFRQGHSLLPAARRCWSRSQGLGGMALALGVLLFTVLPAKAQVAGLNWQCVAGDPTRLCPVNSTYPLPVATSGSSTPDVGITPTDATITSATGASQTVMAANTSRHSLTIVNTGNANCGVNPTGGTAALGGAGTLTLYPGGAYTPSIPTLSAVTAICTAGQPLYADQN